MSDYLPADIWSEIFLKLPVESLIRFTAVCKSWKALIVSPAFIYAHLSLSKNHSILRCYHELDMDDDYLSRNFMARGSNGCFEVTSLNSKLTFKSKTERYGLVGSCDGIVCLTDSLERVILWNPSVRNHVVLPLSHAIANSKEPQVCLTGFGVANHVYKAVRLVYRTKHNGYGFCIPPQAEIFSIGMEGWRSVGGFDIKLGYDFMKRQVFLNGIIHWLLYEPIEGRFRRRSSILTFDMGDEVFGEVMLPDVLVKEYLCLYKIGESLAVMEFGSFTLNNATDVWVMKEYGVKESWTKLYRIHMENEYRHDKAYFKVIGFKSDEALLDYLDPDECHRLVSNHLEFPISMDLETRGKPRLYIDDYVESLLFLKGNSVPAVGEIGEALVEGLI